LVSDIKGGTQADGVENRVLRGMFGPKGEEVTGGWNKRHNEELNDLYSFRNISIIKSMVMRGSNMYHEL
jgi:hypothetical protein